MRRQVCVLHRVDLHCVHRQLHPCSLWLAAKYGTGMSHFPFLIPTFLVKDALALQGVHLLFFFFSFLTTEVYLCGVILRRRASPCYRFLHFLSVFSFSFCDVYSLYLFWQKQQLWTVGRKQVFLILFFSVCVHVCARVRRLVYLHLRIVNHQVCVYM